VKWCTIVIIRFVSVKKKTNFDHYFPCEVLYGSCIINDEASKLTVCFCSLYSSYCKCTCASNCCVIPNSKWTWRVYSAPCSIFPISIVAISGKTIVIIFGRKSTQPHNDGNYCHDWLLSNQLRKQKRRQSKGESLFVVNVCETGGETHWKAALHEKQGGAM